MVEPQGDLAAQYAALTEGCGLADWHPRTLIEMTGKDRATFLHNFCTNDIQGLTPGEGCELFITDVKGKTLGHGIVLCGPDALVLETTAGQAPRLIEHWDRYLLREEVQLTDRSDAWVQILVVGPQAAATIRGELEIEPPAELWNHARFASDGHSVGIYRTDFFGPQGFCVWGPPAGVRASAGRLARTAVPCGGPAVEVVRLEAGTPWYGIDITDQNLPQEVARDRRAISFRKGCYLGQETVARIDALGHVNRRLCGVRFAAPPVPAAGAPLRGGKDGDVVGHVTSAVLSLRLGAPLALAYLRRGHDQPGMALEADTGPAKVVALPLGEN